jgi:hypothetical protein
MTDRKPAPMPEPLLVQGQEVGRAVQGPDGRSFVIFCPLVQALPTSTIAEWMARVAAWIEDGKPQ